MFKVNRYLFSYYIFQNLSARGYMKAVKQIPPEDIEILGIGIIGSQESVKKIIGDLPLLK